MIYHEPRQRHDNIKLVALDYLHRGIYFNDLYGMTVAEIKEIERKRNWSQTKCKVTLYFLIKHCVSAVFVNNPY